MKVSSFYDYFFLNFNQNLKLLDESFFTLDISISYKFKLLILFLEFRSTCFLNYCKQTAHTGDFSDDKALLALYSNTETVSNFIQNHLIFCQSGIKNGE